MMSNQLRISEEIKSVETIRVKSEKNLSKYQTEEECELPLQRDTLKQYHSFDISTILSDKCCRKCGKEEETLNAMIRRLVDTELTGCCEEERRIVNKAFSDRCSGIYRKNYLLFPELPLKKASDNLIYENNEVNTRLNLHIHAGDMLLRVTQIKSRKIK